MNKQADYRIEQLKAEIATNEKARAGCVTQAGRDMLDGKIIELYGKIMMLQVSGGKIRGTG